MALSSREATSDAERNDQRRSADDNEEESSSIYRSDYVIARPATKLAFGSCHKVKYADPNLWSVIAAESPDAFLWTGDSIYPPVRDVASIELLKKEYHRMLTNATVGYGTFRATVPTIFGAYDDHDYGGNDRGHEMPDKLVRAELFWSFLNDTRSFPLDADGRNKRNGLYYSVMWNNKDAVGDGMTIKAIFLDTRWHRQDHCIPSIAGKIPLGAGIACLTRWLAAGTLPALCSHREHDMLGREQWVWFEQQLREPADALIVVSSVQVLTTNPAMESWGHFPLERKRLLDLLLQYRNNDATVILSGDVHHGEVLDPLAGDHFPVVEVTSSGLTHSCQKHIYGAMCEPLLKSFHKHRSGPNYYLGRNFGTIVIDETSITVNVHDASNGTVVLSTGPRSILPRTQSFGREKLDDIPQCMDGHLLPYFSTAMIGMMLVLWMLLSRRK
jgi:alkaline phosphatase D